MNERQKDQDVAERMRRENLERASAPKDNEVDEKVIARYVWTNAGMKGGEPQWAGNWVRYDAHAATVAELRADRDSWREQAEDRLREWDKLRAEVESERKLRMRAEGLFVEWKKRHDYLIDGIAAIQKTRDTAERRGEVLRNALQVLFDDYKALADSGDAGNWSLEDTDAGKVALAALTGADQT